MTTTAEKLIDLAREVIHPRKLVIHATGSISDEAFARIKLALDFNRLAERHPATAVRAIVEDWPCSRIVREVY